LNGKDLSWQRSLILSKRYRASLLEGYPKVRSSQLSAGAFGIAHHVLAFINREPLKDLFDGMIRLDYESTAAPLFHIAVPA
jgi:hypothetical protein